MLSILFSFSAFDITVLLINSSFKSNSIVTGKLVSSSKDLAPTASGQYFADVSPLIPTTQDAIWNQTALVWQDNNSPVSILDYIWNIFQKYRTGKADGGFIDTERVWVSGSNDPAIKDYVSSNENATFNTYQN